MKGRAPAYIFLAILTGIYEIKKKKVDYKIITFPDGVQCVTQKIGPDRFSCFDVYWIYPSGNSQ